MQINKRTLANGLRLVHQYMPGTQMVALNVLYDVGARDEHPTHTGLAHLFEHLMFGGSAHIPNYDTPLQLAGGENNAWTGNDLTNFYLTLPAANAETGFWLESDRMLALAFNPQSLEVQRQVVMEEFEQQCLNVPYGDVGHLIRGMAYQVHPYRWPTIGLAPEHIAATTMDDVKNFFNRHYAPNNAILAVTGHITWEETLRLTERWFGDIERREIAPRQLPQEPRQTNLRRLTVERPVPVDSLHMAYHMCPRTDPCYHTFDLLSDILSNGHSSRLNQRLVEERKLFSSIDAYIDGSRDAGLLHISGKLASDISLEQAEEAVRKELTLLQQTPVGSYELTKVKNRFESTQIFGNINYLHVATQLAYFELISDAGEMPLEVQRYRAVTADALQQVARESLTDDNLCVLYYKSKPSY